MPLFEEAPTYSQSNRLQQLIESKLHPFPLNLESIRKDLSNQPWSGMHSALSVTHVISFPPEFRLIFSINTSLRVITMIVTHTNNIQHDQCLNEETL